MGIRSASTAGARPYAVALIAIASPSGVFAQPGSSPPAQSAQPRIVSPSGITVDASLGAGVTEFTNNTQQPTVSMDYATVGLAGGLGVGAWLSPHVALTGRVVVERNNLGGWLSVFVGPSLQYWIRDDLWIGGGVGLATLRTANGNGYYDGFAATDVMGLGFDLRAGYAFGHARAANVSIELTPAVYGNAIEAPIATGPAASVALLVGYQSR